MQFVFTGLISGFHFPVMEFLLTLQRDNLPGRSGVARGKGQGSKQATFLKELIRKMAFFSWFSLSPPPQEPFFLTCASSLRVWTLWCWGGKKERRKRSKARAEENRGSNRQHWESVGHARKCGQSFHHLGAAVFKKGMVRKGNLGKVGKDFFLQGQGWKGETIWRGMVKKGQKQTLEKMATETRGPATGGADNTTTNPEITWSNLGLPEK